MRQLSTTEINEHFGVTMSAGFITDTLGVAEAGKMKRATLWNESQLPAIGSALGRWAEERGQAAPGAKQSKPAASDDNSDLF